MTDPTYNLITISLLAVLLACILCCIAFIAMAIIRWKRVERKKYVWRFVVSLAIGICAIGIHQCVFHFVFWPAVVERTNDSTLLKKGMAVPKYVLTTLSGTEIVLGPDQTNTVILNFFATWCAPCRQELPHLQKFWDEYDNTNNVQLVVVGREQAAELLSDFKQQHGYTVEFASDPNRQLFDMYATHLIPRTVVVGPGGKVIAETNKNLTSRE